MLAILAMDQVLAFVERFPFPDLSYSKQLPPSNLQFKSEKNDIKLIQNDTKLHKRLCIYKNNLHVWVKFYVYSHLFNPLNTKLNPICHMLALLGVHHILHVSRLRVNIFVGSLMSAACILLRNCKVITNNEIICVLCSRDMLLLHYTYRCLLNIQYYSLQFATQLEYWTVLGLHCIVD